MLKSLAFSAALLAVPMFASAQPAPENPRGQSGLLVSYTDTDVTLKDKDGKTVVVQMSKGWTVATARPSTPEAIRPGDFVASANVNVDATTGRANEVRLFEPGYRPENGTHGMPGPANANLSMTHATVTKVSKGPDGQELDLVFPDGKRHLIVPATVKVTAFDTHPRSFLKPGVSMVGAVTRRDPDDVWRAGRLTVNN